MKRALLVAGVATAQLALVAVGVAPQLSARLTGDTYRFEVRPVDPIDPFRGAYVELDYPGLQRPDGLSVEGDTVYVSLTEERGFMVASGWSEERPESGTYLACADRWPLHCGIESWFADQDEARRLEVALGQDGAVAEVRIDSRGNAAIVGLEPR